MLLKTDLGLVNDETANIYLKVSVLKKIHQLNLPSYRQIRLWNFQQSKEKKVSFKSFKSLQL